MHFNYSFMFDLFLFHYLTLYDFFLFILFIYFPSFVHYLRSTKMYIDMYVCVCAPGVNVNKNNDKWHGSTYNIKKPSYNMCRCVCAFLICSRRIYVAMRYDTVSPVNRPLKHIHVILAHTHTYIRAHIKTQIKSRSVSVRNASIPTTITTTTPTIIPSLYHFTTIQWIIYWKKKWTCKYYAIQWWWWWWWRRR